MNGATASSIAAGGLTALLFGCAPQNAPATPTRDTPTAVAASVQLVDIAAGTFVMGTVPDKGFQNGFPPHKVAIKAFRLGRYDVTFDQYDAFARATHRELPPDETWGRGSRPVIHVSWRDAHDFVVWLNGASANHFRLPTEAEWEYASRGGTTTLYWWGDEPNPDMANTVTNAGRDHFVYTSPVGSFPANPFGLYDMSGNVWQLVEDCRHGTYENAPSDGRAWLGEPCDSHIARGGSYSSIRRGMQVAARVAAGETYDAADLGFRLAEDR